MFASWTARGVFRRRAVRVPCAVHLDEQIVHVVIVATHAGARAQPEAPAAPRRPAIDGPSVHVGVACMRHAEALAQLVGHLLRVRVRVRVRARARARARARFRA